MFSAKVLDSGEILLAGRLDASQIEIAENILKPIVSSRTINLKELDYISSAGLGILLAHQKRLNETGHSIRLTNMNKHVKDVFFLTGFDQIFEIG